MDVNDNAGCLDARVVWTCIASRLAPTGVVCNVCTSYLSPPVTRTAISIARTLIAAKAVSGVGWGT
ncbi:hypothetical protein PMI33_00466 [Pseudomonas sp. GM67]|nr:hypothetical protein PMI33_00466 [Pseudomonas sp. GM67]